jgi:hypothetical protein
MDDIFDEIYNNVLDEFLNIPYTNRTQLTSDIQQAIQINNRLIQHMSNIRQYLDLYEPPSPPPTQLSPSPPYTPPPTPPPRAYTYGYGTTTMNSYNLFNTNTNFLHDIFLQMIDNNHDMDDVKVVLTKDEFNKLQSIYINESVLEDYKNQTCNICMDDYTLDETIIHLPCKHCFHKKCIESWLCNEKITCPICRHDVREIYKDV